MLILKPEVICMWRVIDFYNLNIGGIRTHATPSQSQNISKFPIVF